MGYSLSIVAASPEHAKAVAEWMTENIPMPTTFIDPKFDPWDPNIREDVGYAPHLYEGMGYGFPGFDYSSFPSSVGYDWMWRTMAIITRGVGLDGFFYDSQFFPLGTVKDIPIMDRDPKSLIRKVITKLQKPEILAYEKALENLRDVVGTVPKFVDFDKRPKLVHPIAWPEFNKKLNK